LKDEDYIKNNFIVMCTKKGVIKKTSLESYSRPRTNGINAITIREGDQLLEAKITNGENEIMMALKSGKAIRFNEKDVRSMGRTASGVRGIRLTDENKDEVVGMICVENEEANVMVVSENGYGKRSVIGDYRITKRGGKGVKTINITEKTGELISLKNVSDEDDLMIINKSGIAIRLKVSGLRVMGRATQGVRLINLKGNDGIAAVAKIAGGGDDEDEDSADEVVDLSDVPQGDLETDNSEESNEVDDSEE
jgi:DNA gyrase subunit A